MPCFHVNLGLLIMLPCQYLLWGVPDCAVLFKREAADESSRRTLRSMLPAHFVGKRLKTRQRRYYQWFVVVVGFFGVMSFCRLYFVLYCVPAAKDTWTVFVV